MNDETYVRIQKRGDVLDIVVTDREDNMRIIQYDV